MPRVRPAGSMFCTWPWVHTCMGRTAVMRWKSRIDRKILSRAGTGPTGVLSPADPLLDGDLVTKLGAQG